MSFRRRRLAAMALAATAVLAPSACGEGDDERGASEQFLPGNSRIGAGGGLSGAAQANCRQWRDASFRQRQAVVEQLRILGARGTNPGQGGRKLPLDEAYDLLERTCDQDYAVNFKLYKIYNRALAFSPR